MSLLKLLALDSDDLLIISTYAQDAILQIKDIDWQPKNKRLIMAIKRFAWENEKWENGKLKRFLKRKVTLERHFAVLRFDRVEKVQVRGLHNQKSGEVLSLLAIQFEPLENPAGIIQLQFSGDVILRLQIECIECQLEDLGPIWQAKNRPHHD